MCVYERVRELERLYRGRGGGDVTGDGAQRLCSAIKWADGDEDKGLAEAAESKLAVCQELRIAWRQWLPVTVRVQIRVQGQVRVSVSVSVSIWYLLYSTVQYVTLRACVRSCVRTLQYYSITVL